MVRSIRFNESPKGVLEYRASVMIRIYLMSASLKYIHILSHKPSKAHGR
jgi:hypothetical protein